MVLTESIMYLTKTIFPELPLQANSVGKIYPDVLTFLHYKEYEFLKEVTGQTKIILKNKKVLSNLPLQMALYYNVIFAPVWIIIILLFLFKNYSLYEELYKYIIVTVICTILFVEILRLYLGFEGNLKDKIPELAGFWMLSILLQFPLQGLLLFNPYFKMYILEIIVQAIMFSILCVQLVSGYFALKYTAAQQSKMYQNKQKNIKRGSTEDED